MTDDERPDFSLDPPRPITFQQLRDAICHITCDACDKAHDQCEPGLLWDELENS